MTEKGVKGGFNVAKEAIRILIKKIVPKNKILCEPQMGKRKLYDTLSTKSGSAITKHYMDFLQYANGKNDINDISRIIKISAKLAKKIFMKMKKNNLIY